MSNNFPVGMVLDDQLFGLTIVASHCLEARRGVLTAEGVEEDSQVLFHFLNQGLWDQEVMDGPQDGATRAMRYIIWIARGKRYPTSTEICLGI